MYCIYTVQLARNTSRNTINEWRDIVLFQAIISLLVVTITFKLEITQNEILIATRLFVTLLPFSTVNLVSLDTSPKNRTQNCQATQASTLRQSTISFSEIRTASTVQLQPVERLPILHIQQNAASTFDPFTALASSIVSRTLKRQLRLVWASRVRNPRDEGAREWILQRARAGT